MGQQVTSNKQLAESISCIITIHKKRYDVTQFLKEHPGGEDVILKHNGIDATVVLIVLKQNLNGKFIIYRAFLNF